MCLLHPICFSFWIESLKFRFIYSIGFFFQIFSIGMLAVCSYPHKTNSYVRYVLIKIERVVTNTQGAHCVRQGFHGRLGPPCKKPLAAIDREAKRPSKLLLVTTGRKKRPSSRPQALPCKEHLDQQTHNQPLYNRELRPQWIGACNKTKRAPSRRREPLWMLQPALQRCRR